MNIWKNSIILGLIIILIAIPINLVFYAISSLINLSGSLTSLGSIFATYIVGYLYSKNTQTMISKKFARKVAFAFILFQSIIALPIIILLVGVTIFQGLFSFVAILTIIMLLIFWLVAYFCLRTGSKLYFSTQKNKN